MKDFVQVETADKANLKKNKGIEVFLFHKKYYIYYWLTWSL